MLRMLRLAIDPSVPGRVRWMALGNIVGTSYWTGSVTSISLVTLLDVIPSMSSSSNDVSALWVHYVAIFYLVVNVVGNAINVMTTDTSVNSLDVDQKDRQTLPHWCRVCDRNTPRRSHHCPLCGVCVLKRDHHCFFLATCVGYHNQRYFATFCGFQAAGGVYGALLVAIHLHKRFDVRFSGLSTLATLMPTTVWEWWFTEAVSVYHLFLVWLFYSCLICGTLAAGFAMWQWWVIVNGQTTHEALHDMDTYSRTVSENIREVFGPRWFVSAILPIPTRLEGQGTYGPGEREEMALTENNNKGEKRTRPRFRIGKLISNRQITKATKKSR